MLTLRQAQEALLYWTFSVNSERGERARHTVHWVEASCRADSLPEWLVRMVVGNFLDTIMITPEDELLALDVPIERRSATPQK